MQVDNIRFHALSFRNAIEKCVGRLRAISLVNFPKGSCGDASTLLGLHLQRVLKIEVEYVAGVKGGEHHAWIEYCGIAIDITADQYAGLDKLIVELDSEWHKGFKIEHRRSPHIDTESEEHKDDLEHDFSLISGSVLG